jgi:hypothetical protein
MSQDPQNIGTTTIRVGGMPFIVKLAEWKWDRLYSTISFSDGDSQKRELFVTQPGINIQGGNRTMSDVDTNVPDSGKLPIDHEFYVFSPRLRILRVVGSEDSTPSSAEGFDDASLDSDTPNRRMLFELNRKVKCNFFINNKVRSEGRFEDYPSAGGIYLVTQDIGESLANMGVPSPRDGFALVVPFHLRANVSYKWTLAPVVGLALNQAQQVDDQDNTSVEVQGVIEGLYKVPVT